MNKKTAIVTGGGKGIGEAIVKELVKSDFNVGIADIDEESAKKLAASLGDSAKSYYTDVSDYDDICQLVNDAVNDFGRLDVMINNAGLSREYPLMEMTGEELDQLYNINVKGVLFGIQGAAKQFIKQGSGGKIINAASIGGYKVSPGHAGY